MREKGVRERERAGAGGTSVLSEAWSTFTLLRLRRGAERQTERRVQSGTSPPPSVLARGWR